MRTTEVSVNSSRSKYISTFPQSTLQIEGRAEAFQGSLSCSDVALLLLFCFCKWISNIYTLITVRLPLTILPKVSFHQNTKQSSNSIIKKNKKRQLQFLKACWYESTTCFIFLIGGAGGLISTSACDLGSLPNEAVKTGSLSMSCGTLNRCCCLWPQEAVHTSNFDMQQILICNNLKFKFKI